MRSFSSLTDPIVPTFGVRRRLLGSKTQLQKSRDFLRKALRTDYHLALFTAVIKALNCEVVEIARHDDAVVSASEEYRYVRDPVVVFHDKKLVMICKGNGEFGSEEILKKFDGYKQVMVNDAYFEGGNIIYLPFLGKVFHGINPGGYYAKDAGLSLAKMTPDDYYKVIPSETNKSLHEQLHPYGIEVESLALNPEVINHQNFPGKFICKDHYYHLDCFMQLLPDGRLIILNKKILSEASCKRLESLLGNKFIDLAYADYLTDPVIFNSIVICKEDNLFIVAPHLPKSVRESLAQLNLTVITPETLTFGSEYYDDNYAGKVAEILQGEGYVKARQGNLATKLAKHVKGYRCNNGKTLTYQELQSMQIALSKYYKFHPISFLVDGGGPHCLTTEIAPHLPKLSDNAHALFYQNNTAVKQASAHYHFSDLKF